MMSTPPTPHSPNVSPHAFSLKYYCTSWGMTESWDAFCAKAKQTGYDGVQTGLPGSNAERELMTTALRNHGLSLAILCGYWGSSEYSLHTKGYRQVLEDALPFQPDHINSQTGKDYYPFEQNKALIDMAEEMGQKAGIPIYHEIHRSRFSFAAHITKDFLERIGYLSLTLDISHWYNVHESFLSDQQEAVALALSRTGHIHARIGHPEGPQVNDPAAPEWKDALEAHLRCWDEVIAQRKAQGHTHLGITTEFGPPDYMPTLPYTRQPLSDQWQVNAFMLNLLKARYAK